jgi:hypothetical protein
LEWGFQTLCTATSSFILINQLNSREVKNDRKRLKAHVLQVMEGANYVSFQLLDRILRETAVDILAKVLDNVEDRRVK